MPCKKVFFHFCSNIFRNYKFQKLCGASVQPNYYTKSYSNPSTSRSVSQSFHSRHKFLVADVPRAPLPQTQFQRDTQASMKTTRGTCNSSKSRFAPTFALPNSCISTNSLRLLHCFLHINLLCKSYGMGGSQRSQCFFRSYDEGPAVPAPSSFPQHLTETIVSLESAPFQTNQQQILSAVFPLPDNILQVLFSLFSAGLCCWAFSFRFSNQTGNSKLELYQCCVKRKPHLECTFRFKFHCDICLFPQVFQAYAEVTGGITCRDLKQPHSESTDTSVLFHNRAQV